MDSMAVRYGSWFAAVHFLGLAALVNIDSGSPGVVSQVFGLELSLVGLVVFESSERLWWL